MPSAPAVIDDPIINSPFEEPRRNYRFGDAGITNEIVEARRTSSYFIPIPPPKKKGKQLSFDTEWLGERVTENEFINRVRGRVSIWRRGGYAGITRATRRLLDHWTNPERDRKLFFCRIEAAETAIYIAEVAGRYGDAWIENDLKQFNEYANPEVFRIAIKLATGSGKTVVMGMLIAWQALNRLTKILAGQDKTGVNKESPDQMVRRVCRELGNKRGIVPRVPVADDQMTGEQPTYRELWIHIRDGLPKKGRGTDALVGEPKLPALLEGALAALYGHYEKAYRRWEGNDEAQARGLTPPVFIVVCNNTNVSKLVFDYVAGWERPRPDGSVALVPGKLAIFSNEQSGRWRSHPNTRPDGKIVVEICGVDVYDPTTGEIRSNSTDDIACWFIDTAYNGESFFVRHACFTGAEDPYEKLKRALRAEIDEAAWSAIYSTVCRPFEPPKSGRIAVKVINHYGDEVLKTFAV